MAQSAPSVLGNPENSQSRIFWRNSMFRQPVYHKSESIILLRCVACGPHNQHLAADAHTEGVCASYSDHVH